VLEWTNTTKLLIHTIDFKSAGTGATPILIAATGITL